MRDYPRLEKPAEWSPCNSCGLCCIKEQCPVSLGMFGEHSVCPALQPDGDALKCALMIDATPYLPADRQAQGEEWTQAIRLVLGAGNGCDSGAELTVEQAELVQGRFYAALALAPRGVQLVAISLLQDLGENA